MERVLPWYAHETSTAFARKAGAKALHSWTSPATKVKPTYVDDYQSHAFSCYNRGRAGEAKAAERSVRKATSALRGMTGWLEANNAQ